MVECIDEDFIEHSIYIESPYNYANDIGNAIPYEDVQFIGYDDLNPNNGTNTWMGNIAGDFTQIDFNQISNSTYNQS